MSRSISAADLGGILAMMPAFATPDAADERATETVAAEETVRAVSALVNDGATAIATTGSFGEFHTLLPDEFESLFRAAVEGAGGRAPVFAGCTGLNTREVLARAAAAKRAGADGLLLGVPFYFPSTQDNARHFFRCLAEAFPDLAVMIYHNPTLHHVTLAPETIGGLVRECPNIIAMKDAHREPREFDKVQIETEHKVSVFVAAWQYPVYADLGAAGFWSYDCWMHPRPHVALLDAVRRGDLPRARQLVQDLHPAPTAPLSLSWRETAAKIAIGYAGYCKPGPLRPPFVHIPEDVEARARARAARWVSVAGQLESESWSGDVNAAPLPEAKGA